MAQHTVVYQHAVYYDIVFDRDVNRDMDFMEAAYRRYTGGKLSSVLDIACGPGYHAYAFTRRGLRAVGLDLRPEMLDYARDKAVEGDSITWLVGDMRNFQLEKPVDMAFCMYDSIDAMLTDTDMMAHFRAVASNLTDGGLYLIECIHPRYCSVENYGRHTHQGIRNGIAVEIVLGANKPHFDLQTHIGRVAIEMIVRKNGHVERILDYAQERLYSAEELERLADLSGALNVVGWYGDMDLKQPMDDSPKTESMICILQKQ